MSSREKGDQSQIFIKEHVGVAVDSDSTNIIFVSQATKAFDSDLKVIGGGEIVMANVVEAEHGFEDEHAAFGKACLDSIGGGSMSIGASGGGRNSGIQNEYRLAKERRKNGVEEELGIKEIQRNATVAYTQLTLQKKRIGKIAGGGR